MELKVAGGGGQREGVKMVNQELSGENLTHHNS